MEKVYYIPIAMFEDTPDPELAAALSYNNVEIICGGWKTYLFFVTKEEYDMWRQAQETEKRIKTLEREFDKIQEDLKAGRFLPKEPVDISHLLDSLR